MHYTKLFIYYNVLIYICQWVNIYNMKDKRLSILAENIFWARRKTRYTQLKLAELVDMSENSIGKIERAEQTPSALVLYDIAKVLGVDIKDLYKGLD